MSIIYPANTILLITAANVGIGVAIWILLSEVLSRLPLAAPVKRNWRLGTALVLAAWLVVRLALEIDPPGGQTLGTPATIGFVVFGLVVGTLPLTLSATFRQIVRAAPAAWLIGLQVLRVVGGSFLVLLDMKLMPSAFALPAGYGDVIVAVLAALVVYLLMTDKPYARTAAILWNFLGILDLVIALATGSTFIPPFAAQLAASGVSVLYLNYVLIIPAYGVPLAFVGHIYSLYQLLSRRVDVTKRNVDVSSQTSAFAK